MQILTYLKNNRINFREKLIFSLLQFRKVKSFKSQKKASAENWNKTNSNIPKIIWLYWDSNELPPLIDMCIQQLKELNPNYEVNLLNEQNYSSYIDSLDISFKKCGIQAFADLLRLKLLSKYGGVWMDASILTFDSLDNIFNNWGLNEAKIILFKHPIHTIDEKFPIFENWFIASEKNNIFIREWAIDFEKCLKSDQPRNYYNENSVENFSKIVQKLPTLDYLMAYVSGQIIHRKLHEAVKIDFFDIEKIGYSYFYYLGHKKPEGNLFHKLLMIYKSPKKINPIVKITGFDRIKIQEFQDKGLINPNSIIGKALNKYYSNKNFLQTDSQKTI